MIELTYGWRCTLCGHGKSINPARDKVPTQCPACRDDGKGRGAYVQPEQKAALAQEEGDEQQT